MYKLIIKMHILLDVTEEITQNVQDLHVDCIYKSAKFSIVVLGLLLRSSACGSEWGNFWCRSLLQVKESAWEGGQMIDHHTAPVRGPVVFPWQIIPPFWWWWWWCFCI